MSPTPEVIARIEAAIDKHGAPEFARTAGIPYTTLRDWQRKGFCPPAIETLAKITQAADQIMAGERQDAA